VLQIKGEAHGAAKSNFSLTRVKDLVPNYLAEPIMKRRFLQAVVLAGLIAGISVRVGSQSKPLDLNAFFTQNIGLKKNQVTDIRNGKPVALNMKSRIPDEIFVFGAVYINAKPEEYVKFIMDTERLSRLPEYPGIGKFSNPPQVADLKNFELDRDDIAALKKCKPGDCMIQMPSKGMELFQKSVNWSAPDADRQVNELLRKTAVQRLLDYQKGGNQVLGEYNDKSNPRKVAEQFRYMISYSKVLPSYLPGFYNYLLNYPEGKPANVEDTFQWAKVKFGLKPMLRLLHIVTMRGSSPNEPAYVIAEKQLYSSHYFATALDLTFCIRDSQDPKKPGFYLLRAMGSEQAGLTGFKGSIVRKAAVGRSVDALEKSLATIKATLEKN
jgi:hypothetical protein